MFLSCFKGLKYVLLFSFIVQISILYAQPVSHRPDVTINELGTVASNSIRIVHNPVSGNLYILQSNGEIRRVNFNTDSSAVTFTTIYQQSDHGLIGTLGMAFGPDGTLYLVGNEASGQLGIATIAKGIPDSPGSENRTWSVLAETVQYSYGSTYNHRMSGIIVDPDNDFVYVNSGARTDHGEERESLREVGLTSIILKLPANGENIILQDDREWLRTNGYLMAEGIRNSFDFAYDGNGDLFSVENSGDRDDPEEMNWIREGHHYGFPWRMGGNNTPQQFTPYDPMSDPLLSEDAWGGGDLYATFYNDPDYPSPPPGVTFTEPVMNSGPVADKFRDPVTGEVKDASELGITVTTFTSHRSPNGIVFDKDYLLENELKGGAFVISLAAGGTFQPFADTSQDLLHIDLTKLGDTAYTAETRRIVSGFNSPLGIEIVGNKLYVIETGLWFPSNPNPKLWEITLPGKVIPVELTSFSASVLKNSVLLNWATATELNNHGFEVQKKLRTAQNNWLTIGFVEGTGTTTEKKEYKFIDKNPALGIIKYRLKQVDFDGAFSYSEVVQVDFNIPDQFSLSQNYPNPFNPETKIKYAIGSEQLTTLKVFDILGKEVALLVNEKKPAGNYEIEFDASFLPSGVYFYKLNIEGESPLIRKMVLLK